MKLKKVKYVYAFAVVCSLLCTTIVLPETQSCHIRQAYFKKLYTLEGHKDIVQSLQILKDGSLVSGSADTTLRIWDMNGTCIQCLPNHAGWINTISELSDGRIACGSNDGTILFWNSKKGTYTTLTNLDLEGNYANSIVQLNLSTIAFGTWKRMIKLWDIEKDVCLKMIDKEMHAACISSLIALKDGHYLVTSSWDSTIKIWDISKDTPTCVRTLKEHSDCINEVVQLDKETFVSAADDALIKIWNINSNESNATLCGHRDNVYSLVVVNGKIASGSRDKTVKIWDPQSRDCLMTIPCNDKIYSLAFSPQMQHLFVGLGHGDIEVFQVFF